MIVTKVDAAWVTASDGEDHATIWVRADQPGNLYSEGTTTIGQARCKAQAILAAAAWLETIGAQGPALDGYERMAESGPGWNRRYANPGPPPPAIPFPQAPTDPKEGT